MGALHLGKQLCPETIYGGIKATLLKKMKTILKKTNISKENTFVTKAEIAYFSDVWLLK